MKVLVNRFCVEDMSADKIGKLPSLAVRDTMFKAHAYCGGTASFNKATATMLHLAVKNAWVLDNQEQGCGLNTQEYIDFLERNPRFTAHGRVTSPKHHDPRVELSGVMLDKSPTKKEIIDFVNTFRGTEHFIVTPDSLFVAD